MEMEMVSALMALCAGNSPVMGGFPHERVTDADVSCVPSLNKLLQKIVEMPVVWNVTCSFDITIMINLNQN